MVREYYTERLKLKVLDASHTEQVLAFYKRNRVFLEEWEAARTEAYYTREAQEKQLMSDLKDIEEKRALRLWVFHKEDRDDSRVIGVIAFFNIVWGAFLSAISGYKMDKDEINKGYVTEALRKGIDIMFNEYGLHRIEANIMPKNIRSQRVVEKLGFYSEGTARKYLKINGKWEDHIHMVLLNEKME